MERKQIKTLCKRDGMNAVYFGMDIAQINPQVVYKAVLTLRQNWIAITTDLRLISPPGHY